MNLPGLITIRPDQHDLLAKAAQIIGDSFIEEPWSAVWVSALDKFGADTARKQEILRASLLDELTAHARYQGAYLLEDETAAFGGYLYSELEGRTHTDLDADAPGFLDAILTPDERKALTEQAAAMERISQFDWTRVRENEGDHIYLYSWAVDKNARGKGSLRRMVEPIFAYADEHNLNCYLECYSDHLQSMYEHFGFEIVDVLSDPAFDITERRMIRRPNA